MTDIINKTYCNPTPLPDYPMGRRCYHDDFVFKTDYRETADPSVIYEDGKWYLYPSCGMVYISEDFIHWTHQHMEPYDCGYAPTVVKHKGKFLLTACGAGLWMSDSPVGPFAFVGDFLAPNGEVVKLDDPMLFSDDDERLYLYGGCGGAITGVELDSDNPVQMKTENSTMFSMDTINHEWERMGDWNQDGTYSWVEGSWMYKRGDTYYLTYAAPGTEWSSYGMGAYKSKSPLGPWSYMSTSPFLIKKYGIVRGPGHGCLVDGPNGTVWAFYTCCMCYGGKFERRIGYDPVGFDENGDIIPVKATEIPQYAPGVLEKPYLGNDVGLLPMTQHMEVFESSMAPGRDGLYAVDDSVITWWQPAADDENPTLTVVLTYAEEGLDIYAMRIIWRDVGLSISNNYMAGPFKYRVEAQDSKEEWHVVLDMTDNNTDMNIDYLPIKHMKARAVRLVITGKPEHIEPGVTNFTVFGKWEPDQNK